MLGERQSGLKPPNNFIRNTLVHLGLLYWATPNGTRACVLWDGKAYTGQSLRLVTRQADVACACTVWNRDRPLRCSDRSAACAAQGSLSWTITPGASSSGPHGKSISPGRFVVGLCAPKLPNRCLELLTLTIQPHTFRIRYLTIAPIPFERDR